MLRNPWTESEIKLLENLLSKKVPYSEIAKNINHSEISIKAKISRLGLSRPQNRWTAKELSILEKNIAGGIDKLSNLLTGRDRISILQKANKLGHDLGGGWTEDQDKYLRKFFPKTHNAKIAGAIEKSISAIRNRAAILKIKKSDRYWDAPDEDFVMKNWDVLSVEEIAKKVQKTKWAVYAKRRELLDKKG